MAAKIVAFDFDGVLVTEDSLDAVGRELRISEALKPFQTAYYEGVRAAKTRKERDEIAAAAIVGVHEVLKGFGRWEIEQACAKVKAINGAAEALLSLRAAGVRVLVLSATAEFVVRACMSNSGLVADEVIATQTAGEGKLLGPPVFIVSGANKQELLERYLRVRKVKPAEAWSVGDSVADAGMWRAVGRKHSVGFNYLPGVERFVHYKLFKKGDSHADLRRVAELVLQ